MLFVTFSHPVSVWESRLERAGLKSAQVTLLVGNTNAMKSVLTSTTKEFVIEWVTELV